MMMNSFMSGTIQPFRQPVKPVVFVVLDAQKQKREEKGAEKPSQIVSSFVGYRHFELKRNGERVFGNDLMGRKPAMRIETDEKKDAPKDTPSKEQKESQKETGNERRGHEDKYGPDVQPGGFRVGDARGTKLVMRIEEAKTGEQNETPKDTTQDRHPKEQVKHGGTENKELSRKDKANDDYIKGILRSITPGNYC